VASFLKECLRVSRRTPTAPQEAADLINRVLDRGLVLGLERFGAGMDCVLAEYLKRQF